MGKIVKLKPSDTTVDHRYQRTLDARRVEHMVERFDADLLGVPVVSLRSDGTYVRIDGQHRLAAAIAAGRGDVPVSVEVVEGLDIEKESQLFLRLNGGRKAVGAIDKYKARLVAKEPVALEIQGILKKHGCRIMSTPSRGAIQAVQAVECAYHRGNLDSVIHVLGLWMGKESEGFDGMFIRGMSAFLDLYADADLDMLITRLRRVTASSLLKQLKRESRDTNPKEGAIYVFLGIYNHATAKSKRLSGMAQQLVSAQAASAN